jgi:hypothetical protein
MFLQYVRISECSKKLTLKVVTERKEWKNESQRGKGKGKIASGLKYYAVFAYGGRGDKTPHIDYIEMSAYLQGSVMWVKTPSAHWT